MCSNSRKHFLHLVAMALIASGESAEIDFKGFRVLTNGVGANLELEYALYRDAMKNTRTKKLNFWQVKRCGH